MKRKPSGYWKKVENQRAFWDELSARLGWSSDEDWGNVTAATVRKSGGSSLLSQYLDLKKALEASYPDKDWAKILQKEEGKLSVPSTDPLHTQRPPEGSSTSKKRAPGKDLMLSQVWNEEIDPTGYWISEKYDGIRAFWSGSILVSRYGRPLSPPQWFLDSLPPNIALDGELWAGYERFGHLIRVLKSSNEEDWRSCKFMAFDSPDDNLPFEERLSQMRNTVSESDFLEFVPYTKCTGTEHLKEELRQVVNRNGEGLMIRKPEASYLAGRSYNMLKVKLQQDAEVKMVCKASKCVGYDCMLPNDVMITIRCTYTDFKHPPPAGTILKVKHFGEWKLSGKLKNPYFWRIRNDGVTWEELVERYNIDRGIDPAVNPDYLPKE